MTDQTITDDVIRDLAENVLRSQVADVDYLSIGEIMSGDERVVGLTEEQFDRVQMRVSDMLSEATVTITWPEAGAAS